MTVDITRLRRDFPLLSSRIQGQPLIYLDNAATTQKPRCVIDSLTRFYKLSNSNVHRGSHTLANRATTAFEAARVQLQQFINAPAAHEIIWTRGATEAANLIAYSYLDPLLQPGDTILISLLEHHANLVPWQQIAIRHQAQLVTIPLTTEHQLDLEHYQTLLQTHTPKLVALSHVSNTLGVINPLLPMIQAAKAQGATVVIDGAQAVAHLPVDVQALGCDFYFFSGHKCFGPTGIGVLWGRESLLEAMPPWQFGGEMISQVSLTESQFNQLPFKFEAGTPPIAQAIALAEATRYLAAQDQAALLQHKQALRRRLVTWLQRSGAFQVLARDSENNVGIVAFYSDQLHPQDLALWLDQAGIAVRSGHHCTQPLMQALGLTGTLRVSLALYNTAAEIDRLIEQLQAAVTALGQPAMPTTPGEAAQLPPFTFCPPPLAQLIGELEQQPNWQQRLTRLQHWGRQLPVLAPALKRPEYLVPGCEARLWLHCQTAPDRLSFAIDSDAPLMRGLAYLLLAAVQHQPPASIATLQADSLLAQTGLAPLMSQSRSNGVSALLKAIHNAAYKT